MFIIKTSKAANEQGINWVKPKKQSHRSASPGSRNLRESPITAFHFVVFLLNLKLQLTITWKPKQDRTRRSVRV